MNRLRTKWLPGFAALAACLCLLTGKAAAEIRIGVIVWGNEPRYMDSGKGVIEQLRKDGFAEPRTKFIMKSADGNKAKLPELIRELNDEKADLIVALGTTAVISVAREIKDIPVVFSVVYDPVETKIVKDWNSPGGNVTGVSNRVPMSQLVDRLTEFGPVRRLAVIYNPLEKNSEQQLKELQAVQSRSSIRVVPVPVNSTEEVGLMLPEVVRTTDAIYLSGSLIVSAAAPLIVHMASRAGVPTISHLCDLVDKGVLLGVCANDYQLGRRAGRLAVRILRGAKPASIPIEVPGKLDLTINLKTAKAGNFVIPPAFMKSAARIVE